MSKNETRDTKRKRSQPPKEDASSSDESERTSKKTKRSPVKRKTKPLNDGSSSDDDKNSERKIRSLDNADMKKSKDTENVFQPPVVVRFDEDNVPQSLGGFLEALMGNRGPSKLDIIRKRIKESSMTDDMKGKLNKKLDKTPFLDPKQDEWFEQLLSIPFGKFSPLPIDIAKDDVEKYFIGLMETLNKAVYGLENVKEEIINYVAQCLTSTNPSPRILALQGMAGTGKTQIVRNGIAKVLGTPMQTFSMGGIKDSSHFVGFDYTYQNSKYGAISQALMDSGVMNPVIFLDELDKISDWYEGEEVKNLLIHMTDPVQNHEFKDKYFEGLNIDLSKVIFIFAFNDIEKINPILRDRLHIIKIANPTDKDKLIIANNYVIDELLKNITLEKSDFTITDGAMMNIIQKHSNKNSGIRSVKDCIRTILLKVNTLKLLGKATIKKIGLSFNHELKEDKKREKNKEEPVLAYTFPIVINENNVDVFLGSKESSDEKYLSMYI
ncbi:MAG: AAA family ATPase [Candidatus Colwellbacteria bacterium]|nr:AAA family ATPase [Candidatus Colwellbacteria bacterium]